jgi:predicted porin
MQKKLLTLAVAAAMAAPAAALAEATLYGKLHQSIDYYDINNAEAPTYDVNGNVLTDGQDFTGWGVSAQGMRNNDLVDGPPVSSPGISSRANRLGVKGSEDLGGGLKAIYQVELGLSLNDDDIDSGGNGISYRNSFVGLAGEWGTVLVGRHDTPYKISTSKLDQFSDTIADFNSTVGFDDNRTNNTIAYISPSFSGFSFAGAIIAPGSGTTSGGDTNLNADSLAEAYSLGLIYRNGPFYASAAYENMSDEVFMDTIASEADGNCDVASADFNAAACNKVGDDYSHWKLSLGLLDWNGFTLAAIYAQQDDIPGGRRYAAGDFDSAAGIKLPNNSNSADLWQIQAGYAFGNNKVKAMYGRMDRDGDWSLPAGVGTAFQRGQLSDFYEGDRETWAIGFDHSFSKRTKAYAIYTSVDDDRDGLDAISGVTGAEYSAFSLGMIHKF